MAIFEKAGTRDGSVPKEKICISRLLRSGLPADTRGIIDNARDPRKAISYLLFMQTESQED